eukprot:2334310-Amphidinium_carterae.1
MALLAMLLCAILDKRHRLATIFNPLGRNACSACGESGHLNNEALGLHYCRAHNTTTAAGPQPFLERGLQLAMAG